MFELSATKKTITDVTTYWCLGDNKPTLRSSCHLDSVKNESDSLLQYIHPIRSFGYHIMKISQVAFSVLALTATTIEAYSTQASSRRAFVQSAAAAVVIGTATAANAMEACPKGSNNCIRTTWTPPTGASKADIASTVKAVLSEYPQVRVWKRSFS